ncbi:glycosyl hydrolase family 28 protein [Bradyrhizobium quebecense]|uniref:Glycoside hydrolase family 28 protein n=1 Tax=Bradyrhizobium quebecense TaxID=2748629 RepID=A0ACD3V2F1_9BRAD|nr:glycosyl hydrolase family 28 protein [Bradyrhizobium quebecense]UGY00566.1 glycoside hydrolase family 28 protein [Bradyrhizobium quebecense]
MLSPGCKVHVSRRRAQTESGNQNAPRLIQIDQAQNITFYGVTLRNAPNFHVGMNRVGGATFWGGSRSVRRPRPATPTASTLAQAHRR